MLACSTGNGSFAKTSTFFDRHAILKLLEKGPGLIQGMAWLEIAGIPEICNRLRRCPIAQNCMATQRILDGLNVLLAEEAILIAEEIVQTLGRKRQERRE